MELVIALVFFIERWYCNGVGLVLGVISNWVMLAGLTIMGMVSYTCYFASSVYQIAKWLDIPIFTLPNKNKDN